MLTNLKDFIIHVMITSQDIFNAHKRISPFINRTPIISSEKLNSILGHEIYFKAEGMQITGSFKVRGALNTILSLTEQNNLPKKITAYSSGNHAKAIAWAGKEICNIPTEIYMHKSASSSKIAAIRELGANLIITDTRIEAETNARIIGAEPGNYFIHPSDNDVVIAGATTLAIEAFEDLDFTPDAVFASCGGGALLSGAFLAKSTLNKNCQIYASEPAIANDGAISYKTGQIFAFKESPQTIADGLRSLKISERTFKYLKELDGFIEISEPEILYWSVWLNKLLDAPSEPTAATAMAAAFKWLKLQKKRSKILVILSGGNIDQEILPILEKNAYLQLPPSLDLTIS